jgi:hypothetical protein
MKVQVQTGRQRNGRCYPQKMVSHGLFLRKVDVPRPPLGRVTKCQKHALCQNMFFAAASTKYAGYAGKSLDDWYQFARFGQKSPGVVA